MKNNAQYLRNLGIQQLNSMQEEVLDQLNDNRNLVLHSPTGTGKTVAFLLAILHRLREDEQGIQAVVVVPARELAIQVDQVFRKMGTGFSIACVYGGHAVREEIGTLRNAPAVLVGTPGRIVDLAGRDVINLQKTRTLVLDEFDKSLELGFEKEMAILLNRLPALDFRLLTSATYLDNLPGFVGMDTFRRIVFDPAGNESNTAFYEVQTRDTEKMETALQLSCGFDNEPSIFFCNHREAADRLGAYFRQKGWICSVFHGGMLQANREKALIRFRNGSCPVLIATDLAARGLDIEAVQHVVHFQLPEDEKTMVHRNGRTARAGKSGSVYFIFTEKDKRPDFIPSNILQKTIDGSCNRQSTPKWETLFFDLGKKDRVNKTDLVGFLCKAGQLDKADIGMISVLDRNSFVAIRNGMAREVMRRSAGQKLKKKTVRIEPSTEVI